MKIVLQSVKKAEVLINNKDKNSIGNGFLILVGFTEGDTSENVDKMIYKVSGLRIFEDENGKMNKSLTDINGEIMIVSNFTLYADMSHGFRPSFIKALHPEKAVKLYDEFVEKLRKIFPNKIQTGEFGADMEISLINMGPKTFVYEI